MRGINLSTEGAGPRREVSQPRPRYGCNCGSQAKWHRETGGEHETHHTKQSSFHWPFSSWHYPAAQCNMSRRWLSFARRRPCLSLVGFFVGTFFLGQLWQLHSRLAGHQPARRLPTRSRTATLSHPRRLRRRSQSAHPTFNLLCSGQQPPLAPTRNTHKIDSHGGCLHGKLKHGKTVSLRGELYLRVYQFAGA